MEIKKSISHRVNVKGRLLGYLGRVARPGSQRGIDRRILLMRSGGGERVPYPDSGKELTCHQLTLTDVTENASHARQILMPGRPVAALTSPIFPEV